MSKSSFKKHLNAAPDRVFAVASDIPVAPQHFSGITRFEVDTMAGAMQKRIEGDLEDLKAACEGGRGAPNAQPVMA